jgi:hypothetical protein
MKRLVAVLAVSFLLLLTMNLDCFGIGPPIPKEELIKNSRDIIHGIVKEVRCEWNKNHTWIHTYVRLEVLDVFKGESRDEVVVQIPGGTIKNPNISLIDSVTKKIISDTSETFVFRGGGGDTSLWVEDTPVFKEGMEVVIHTFLYENGNVGIYGAVKGVYVVNNGVVEELNIMIEQFRNFVDEVIREKEDE